jgi:hypothetical protein
MLYTKLNNSQLSNKLEVLLNKFAVTLHNTDNANITRVLAPLPPLGHHTHVCAVWCVQCMSDVLLCCPGQVHKLLAGTHWEELGSKVMIGIKCIMDVAMP